MEDAPSFSRRRCARVLPTTLVTTGLDPVVHADCGSGNLSANPIELPFRMDCRIKSGNDEGERTKKKKRKRNADRRVQPTSASRDAARVQAGRARLSAFHHGSYRQGFRPWAQLQARLPGTWQDVRSCKLAPTGERRSRVLTRALPAPACPSPGNAPPGPVIVPVSMMPEAARVRSVSFRARAPHSLHLSEYLRDRRPR